MVKVGLDLGGTNLYAVVVDGEEVLGHAKLRTPPWPGPPESPGAPLPVTAEDLAATLLNTIERGSPAGRRLNAQLQRLGLETAEALTLKFRHPTPRASSLLDLGLTPWIDSGSTGHLWSFGEYDLTDVDESTISLIAHRSQTPGPREIVERAYDDFDAALADLRRGVLQAIDRVPPQRRERVRQLPGVELVEYARPSVQILVFNRRIPLLSRQDARVGLFRAIDTRQLGGDTPPADLGLPTVWRAGRAEPHWALALWNRAEREGVRRPPRLRLAHPPTESARSSAEILAKQFALDGQGIPIQLVELNAAGLIDPASAADTWDLLLVEWHLMEPSIDWPTMLTWAGVETPPATLQAAMKRLLDEGSPPVGTAQALAELAEWVGYDATWAVVKVSREFAARGSQVEGLGQFPVTLYQNLADWRIPLPIEEAPAP